MKTKLKLGLLALILVAAVGCGKEEVAVNTVETPAETSISRTLQSGSVGLSEVVTKDLTDRQITVTTLGFQVVERSHGAEAAKYLEISNVPSEQGKLTSLDSVKAAFVLVQNPTDSTLLDVMEGEMQVGVVSMQTPSEINSESYIITDLFTGEFAESNRLDVETIDGKLVDAKVRVYSSSEDAMQADVVIANSRATLAAKLAQEAQAQASQELESSTAAAAALNESVAKISADLNAANQAVEEAKATAEAKKMAAEAAEAAAKSASDRVAAVENARLARLDAEAAMKATEAALIAATQAQTAADQALAALNEQTTAAATVAEAAKKAAEEAAAKATEAKAAAEAATQALRDSLISK